ncbi:MAG: winged helix-turn-helix domain-containing protein [Thalassotalea sp.]|nr:winged helix-turn-helix domain-containing protein [Thalassotalea sp.]
MIYQFNDIDVDLNQFELRIAGEKTSIEPKVFNLIVYLIQHRERIISRDELFEQVWQGRAVSDTTLSNHIKSARKVLGDNGNAQQVIKTIRTRGYQFIALVEETPFESSVPFEANEETLLKASSGVKQEKISPLKKLLLTFSFIVLAFFIGSIFKSKSDVQPYIVVVPFSVSSEQPDKLLPLADQITRELIQGLRKVSGLKVVPPPSSFTFKENKTRTHIKQQLPEVNFVLDGVINQDDEGNIRISVEFENLEKNTLVWDDNFDIPFNNKNRFTLQRDIATSVSESLKVVVQEEELYQLALTPTQDVEAYNLYTQGRYQLSLMTPDAIHRSIELFSMAIERDRSFEAPYIAKASAYRTLMIYFEKPIDILPKVISSAVDVLAANPDSAQIMSSLGLAYVHAWMWEDAWKMLNNARNKDATIASTELGFSLFYAAMGDKEKVRVALEKADSLDPLNQEIAEWGLWSLMMTNQITAAIKFGEEKVKLHPNLPYPLLSLSVAEYIKGNFERSIKLAEQGVMLSQRDPYSLILLAQAYAANKEDENALELVVEAQAKNQYMCPYETAVVYVLMDEHEKVFPLLAQAQQYQSNCLIFAKNDPRFETIRGDVRYAQLLKSIALDEGAINRIFM